MRGIFFKPSPDPDAATIIYESFALPPIFTIEIWIKPKLLTDIYVIPDLLAISSPDDNFKVTIDTTEYASPTAIADVWTNVAISLSY